MQHPHIAVDHVSVSRTDVRQSRTSLRPSRAKRHLAWEQIELESHGFYAESLHKLAGRFRVLTPMELRVCALIKGMLKSWEIAEMLRIDEKSVERYRVRIRRKLGLDKESLVRYLLED